MRALLTLCLLIICSTKAGSQTPRALRPDISITRIMTVKAEVTRIAFNPIDSAYYYATANGNIYQVIMPNSGSAYDTLIYSIADHGIQYMQGMVFYDSFLYVSGNNDANNPLTTGLIMRGKLQSGLLRNWELVAATAPYPTAGWYDHYFSGLTTNLTGDTLLICSGSRGDHGEVQTNGGVFPGLRNLPLTTVILRIPAAANGLIIPNDSAALDAMGLVFCSGIRNTYDYAYNGAGDLFGCENSGDRDMEDELNYLQAGKHYGFPWMMGAGQNPQQFPTYDPLADSMINRLGWAWTIGSFHHDPGFPQKPAGLQLTLPCRNLGPDAAFLRDSASGKTYNAAASGEPVYSFTPHRSPLGLSFDRDSILGGAYRGAGFVLSYTRGNPSLPDSSALLIPFKDTAEDLLLLIMQKDAINEVYSFQAHKIVTGFNRPVDAVLRDTSMYVIEILYNGEQSLWRLDFPRYLAGPISVNEQKAATSSLAFPNPVDKLLHIPIDDRDGPFCTLRIFDPSGRIVLKEGITHPQLRVSVHTASFAPGVYNWQVSGKGGDRSGKFLVAHP